MGSGRREPAVPRFLSIVFFSVFAARTFIALGMAPGADEAYYFSYILNPALSYFDHPPMVALTGGIVPVLTGWISSLSIRLGSIVLFSFTASLFYLTALELMDRYEAAVAAAVFMVTPVFFISGTLLLPDAPLLFFWVASLYVLVNLRKSPSPGKWLLLGLLCGLGMLSKYTMLFFFAGTFLVVSGEKPLLRQLLTPWPYLALLAAAAVFSPVIIWNAGNGFSSFSFQSGRVGLSAIKFRYFYQSFFGQMGYLLPFVFFPALYYAFRSVYSLLKGRKPDMIVLGLGAVPVFFFMAVSLSRKVLPHWPVIGYATLMLPVGRFYASLSLKRKRLFSIYGFLHISILAAAICAALFQIHFGIFSNRSIKASWSENKEVRDITLDILGWKKLYGYLRETGVKPSELFILTPTWYLAGQINFAVKGDYDVLCLGSRNSARGFSLWQDQESQLGKDAIYIATSRFFRDPVKKYGEYFDEIEPLAAIPVTRAGKTVKMIYLYSCSGFKTPYPVD